MIYSKYIQKSDQNTNQWWRWSVIRLKQQKHVQIIKRLWRNGIRKSDWIFGTRQCRYQIKNTEAYIVIEAWPVEMVLLTKWHVYLFCRDLTTWKTSRIVTQWIATWICIFWICTFVFRDEVSKEQNRKLF